VNFSYESVSNFWQDQGYQWQYGYINVTKYGDMLKTPLSYDTMDNVTNATESGSLATFAKSFAGVYYTANQSGGQVICGNATSTTDGLGNTTITAPNCTYQPPLQGYCSSLDLVAVNITASPDHSFISSNGFGTLKLTSNVTSTPFDDPVTTVSFGSDQEPFGNVTVEGLNESFTKAYAACGKNIQYNATASNPTLHQYQYDILQSETPVNVNLTVVEIRIGVY